MTALLQDALFGDPTPSPAKRTHAHPRAPRRDPEFRALQCQPQCIVCGNPEHPDGLQHCYPACTVLCQHVAQPHKTDVCLITARAAAEIRTSAYSGHAIAVVQCPHCDKPHQHTPTPGVRYAIAGCRLPYIVRTAERSTPWS